MLTPFYKYPVTTSDPAGVFLSSTSAALHVALGHLIRIFVKIANTYDFFDFSYMGDGRIWIGGNRS